MTYVPLNVFARFLALSICALLLQIGFSNTAQAEEGATASGSAQTETRPGRPLPPPRSNVVEAYKEKQEAFRQEIKDSRATLEAEIRDKRAAAESEIKERRAQIASTSAAIRGTIKENRDERKEMIASTSEARRGELQARVEAKRAEMKEKETARREELKSKLAEKGTERYETVTKRLLAAIERLNDISGRIDSRIAKLKAENVTTSAAETLNATAKAAMVTAEAAVQAIPAPTFPATSDASTTPSMINDALKPTREAAYKAQLSIAAAQKALGAVVVELKKAGGSRADAEPASSSDTQ